MGAKGECSLRPYPCNSADSGHMACIPTLCACLSEVLSEISKTLLKGKSWYVLCSFTSTTKCICLPAHCCISYGGMWPLGEFLMEHFILKCVFN